VARAIKLLHCNTLQHTATHCNTLQHQQTKVCPSRLAGANTPLYLRRAYYCTCSPGLCVLQCVAVCCSVLQCDVLCCIVLQLIRRAYYCTCCAGLCVMQCVAMCCNVLQYITVCGCVGVCWVLIDVIDTSAPRTCNSSTLQLSNSPTLHMGWLRLVGSLKL